MFVESLVCVRGVNEAAEHTMSTLWVQIFFHSINHVYSP